MQHLGLESIIWKSLLANLPEFGRGSQPVGGAPNHGFFHTSLAGEIGVKSLQLLKSKRDSGLFWDCATRLLEGDNMQNFAIVSIVILTTPLTFRLVASAQQGAPGQTADAKPPRPGLEVPLVTPGPGWKACPHCENEAYKTEGRKKAKVDTRAFDVHDISGIWSGNPNDLEVNGLPLNMTAVPSFTPYGRKLFDADQSDSPQWNSKDPENTCDPMGWPRWLTFSYGFEFLVLPDRVLQFFEWGHTWRDIWTDGRKLPPNPPISRYLGYAVGKWDRDTFVVESNGYDDRSWLAPAPALRTGTGRPGGYPHSDEMRIEERYKRLNYGLLQVTLTVTDPKVYMAPWTTNGTITLIPNTEMAETFCVPSDSINFNHANTVPTVPKQ
jgi:hypothetical protein